MDTVPSGASGSFLTAQQASPGRWDARTRSAGTLGRLAWPRGGRGRQTGRRVMRRLTINQAADQLGISADAIRGRIKRGTIAHEREGGRVYVLLDADRPRPGRDHPSDHPSDHPGESDALTSQMQGRIDSLERQLEAERQAHGEARRIIAGLVERIPPAIEPPSVAPGSPEAGRDAGEGPPRPDAPEPQEGARRPWWRRWFGS